MDQEGLEKALGGGGDQEPDPNDPMDEESAARKRRAHLASTWLKKVKRAYQDEADWRRQTREVMTRYTDERSAAESGSSQFNIFHANVETLRPAVYSNPPDVEVRRRYLDRDPVGRRASLILQRAIQYSNDVGGFDEIMERDVDDLLMGGRGQMWVRYRPFFKKTTTASQQEPPDDKPQDEEDENVVIEEELVYEELEYDYVPWGYFVFDRASTWKKCRWAARGHVLFRSEVVREYGQAVADAVSYSDYTETSLDTEDTKAGSEREKVAVFWEIWNKTSREAIVVCEGYADDVIKIEKDPLELEGFFPCPEPLMGLHSTKRWIPRPEFLIYQDLANELDDVTMRLKVLTSAVRRRGVYDKSIEGLEALKNSNDNHFVGIDNFRDLFEKGGLAAVFDEQDLTPLITVIRELSARQEILKQLIYEVTGIADIMRGASDPGETYGAQALKSQYGSLRVHRRQKNIARFARNAIRIAGEVIAEHFRPQTLLLVSGVEIVMTEEEVKLDSQMTEQQFMEAIALLKNEKLRGFKIDIDTDSMLAEEDQFEKEQRTDLLGAIGTYLQSVGPIVQQGALTKEQAIELLSFGIRGFKLGSRLEDMIELSLNNGGQENDPGQELQAQLQEAMVQNQQLQEEFQKCQEELQRVQQENESIKADKSMEMQKAEAEIQRKDMESSVKTQIMEATARLQAVLDSREAALNERIKVAEQRSKAAIRQLQARSKANRSEPDGDD